MEYRADAVLVKTKTGSYYVIGWVTDFPDEVISFLNEKHKVKISGQLNEMVVGAYKVFDKYYQISIDGYDPKK